MYGKMFRQMYHGTLATTGPWQAMVTFQQFIVLADSAGTVDMTPEAISRETIIPLEIIQIGIQALEKPDPGSRTPDEEGRRIIRLSDHRQWGWQITNYQHYRQLKREEDRREYHRQYWHSRKLKSLNTTQHTQPSQPIAEAYAEAEAKGTKNTTAATPPGWDEFRQVYPRRAGSQPWTRALKCWNARRSQDIQASEMIGGAKRYAAFVEATGKAGTETVMQAATFLGPDKHFQNPYALPQEAETAMDEIRRLNGGSHHGTVFEQSESSGTALATHGGNVRR